MPSGTVTAFDEHVGLGEITADDGEVIAFQCIGIADGTRKIDVGTAVTFELLAQARPLRGDRDPYEDDRRATTAADRRRHPRPRRRAR